jgi:hypothetical protein
VSNNIRVAVLGTGQMGSGMMKLILEKQGMELVGACDTRNDGFETRTFTGAAGGVAVGIYNNLDAMLKEARPDIALQATCSTVSEAEKDIHTIIKNGINVISIAEEMSFPAAESPELGEKINKAALANNVTVLGTGINPGFVLDLLAIALSGVCYKVDCIIATRINDLSPYGPTVLNSQGVGITPEKFAEGIADGSIVGHYGFPQSIGMIAKALGWKIDRIEEHREPIVSEVERESEFVKILPGMTAGCNHTATAYMDGKPVIKLIHPQQVHPHMGDVTTGDYIEIKGSPDIKLSGSPEIPGGVGTQALAVNMIPRVLNAAPGLKSMIDLPIPAAIMGDARTIGII